jgi:hypothetical protein
MFTNSWQIDNLTNVIPLQHIGCADTRSSEQSMEHLIIKLRENNTSPK